MEHQSDEEKYSNIPNTEIEWPRCDFIFEHQVLGRACRMNPHPDLPHPNRDGCNRLRDYEYLNLEGVERLKKKMKYNMSDEL